MPIFVWIGLALVASYVVQSFLVKQPKQRTTTLDDFDVPQIEDGTPQAVVFGEGWLEGWQVLWYGNFRTTKITAKGGKK